MGCFAPDDGHRLYWSVDADRCDDANLRIWSNETTFGSVGHELLGSPRTGGRCEPVFSTVLIMDAAKSENRETGDFAHQAEQARPGTARELWDFLRHNKKWWLTPIILVLLLIGGLIILASSSAAPFLYTFW